MAAERERKIRERAYHLWVESGHKEGMDEHHWHQATREVDAAPTAGGKASKVEASATAKPKKDTAKAKDAKPKKADAKKGAEKPAAAAKAGKSTTAGAGAQRSGA